MTRKVILGTVLLLLSGCAASTAQKLCARQGHPTGTPAHLACAKQLRGQWMSEARRDLAEGLMLGAAVATQAQAVRSSSSPVTPALTNQQRLLSESWSPQGRMCRFANGTVLNVGSGACPAFVAGPR